MASTRAAKKAARAAIDAAAANVNRSLLSQRQLKIIDSPYKKTPLSIVKFAKTRANQLGRWRRAGTPFLVGQTPVYLPSFTISLIRTPQLAANLAEFAVPLEFNKFDLRDYLWHVYQVRTFAIRSYIRQAPIQYTEPGSRRALMRKPIRYRPKASKRMIVELEKPFVWPEPPTEKELDEDWDIKRWKAMSSDHGKVSELIKKATQKRNLRVHEIALAKLDEAHQAKRENAKQAVKIGTVPPLSGLSQGESTWNAKLPVR